VERCVASVAYTLETPQPGWAEIDVRRWWDALVQASSGMQYEQPGWREGPVFLSFPAPSMAACFLVASGVLAALVWREETGAGQYVRTSLYQGVLAYTTQIWQEHERASAGFRAMMQKTYPPTIHQTSIYECADGEWVHAATMSGRVPTRTVEDVLGLAPVEMAALMRDPELRAQHEERLRVAYRARDRAALIEAFHAAGLGAEAIVPMANVFSHPPFVANGVSVPVDDPELGATTQVGVPAVLAQTPGAVRGGQPRVGEQSREVLLEAGLTAAEIDRLIAGGVVGEPTVMSEPGVGAPR
jgi:crotonobetainyl-CoA:carnitine CoA-transferase CaiB-like acyl-CoA transferase